MIQYKLILLSLLILTTFSCEKKVECYTVPEESCYDEQMESNHSGDCLDDCPSVYGCDGKIYCNECDASRNGISVVLLPLCD